MPQRYDERNIEQISVMFNPGEEHERIAKFIEA